MLKQQAGVLAICETRLGENRSAEDAARLEFLLKQQADGLTICETHLDENR